ncbi:hypothetical protein NJLHNGOC_11325 [Novacetimonas cocois]|uniref:Uncharacterized protein n=1 Tax=Novacetimonas cocois TaxID=1747507 RepID=A0A365YT68_9PROT|nr:hypothetical protein NJLHNGOC_11325 [Novacetimonas cocois]
MLRNCLKNKDFRGRLFSNGRHSSEAFSKSFTKNFYDFRELWGLPFQAASGTAISHGVYPGGIDDKIT